MICGNLFDLCSDGNETMTVRDIVEELTQLCIGVRENFQIATDQKERERIALKHIKEFAAKGARVNDFQKGLEWFNVSENLSTKKHLDGKVTVLDFFTYCCINCMHILPDLDALENKYSVEDGLVVEHIMKAFTFEPSPDNEVNSVFKLGLFNSIQVGVHSAKFANEKDSGKILSAVQRYNIAHPVVNDAKLSMWRDIGIVCWPSLVILGPKGQPLFVLVGEGHREELFLYVKVALAYFKSLDQISNHPLPLKPAQHLLPISKDTLLFPGKVHSFGTKDGERIVVSDTGNNRVFVMDVNGNVEHVVGGYAPAFKDGTFGKAKFNAPQGVCTFGDWIFVADNENHAIRKIDLATETVTTVAGTGKQGRDYTGGKIGKDQPLSSPWDVVLYQHNQGEGTVPILLIAIAGSHQIWALFLEDTVWWKKKEYKAGTCAAIVGNGREENRNNSYPHASSLAQPSGLALAADMKAVFFADSESSSIRRVHLEDGRVSAVCGADRNPANLHDFGDVDGKQFAAKLQHPLGVAWDAINSVVYIADTYNHKIKKVDPQGNCTTLYGAGKPDGNHKFDEPSGLAVSPNGKTLYIADTNNHAIKAVNIENGAVCTIPVKLPEDITAADNTYNFETEISNDGGQLNLSFEVKFSTGLKSNPDAPQRWSVILPADSWESDGLKGNLEEPITLRIPKGESTTALSIYLDMVACRVDECIPKKLKIVFNVNQKSGAPTNVKETKELEIK